MASPQPLCTECTHPPTIVLVHGLFMGRPVMQPLARRLVRHGFAVRTFGYRTVAVGLETNADELAWFLAAIPGPVFLVGHSLGGLVSLRAVERSASGKVCALALLGSPYRRSASAEFIQRWTGGAHSHIGRSLHDWALLKSKPQPAIPLLTIAGTKGRGLGHLLCRFEEPHDGTVALSETVVPGATSRILPVSHTGMLFSPAVADALAGWLLQLPSRE